MSLSAQELLKHSSDPTSGGSAAAEKEPKYIKRTDLLERVRAKACQGSRGLQVVPRGGE